MAGAGRYVVVEHGVKHVYRYMAAVWPPDVENGHCWWHGGPPGVGKHHGRRVRSFRGELIEWLG